MIKISDKLWVIKGVNREDSLAYMCPYEVNKEEQPLSNVVKMQSTGRSWARGYVGATYNERIPVEGEEFVFDNTPSLGFYVGNSVARWSTSNKLFRVKDPRGFTVEIPTDNLATLLHHTTVVKGVVQDECVWGREGNNHILLPVNSEPYLETLGKMDVLENKLISMKDLKVGDWVKLFESDKLYYYAGKVKMSWEVTYYYGGYRYSREQRFNPAEIIEDDKWVDLLIYKCQYSEKFNQETTSKPKIVEVVKNEVMTVTPEMLSLWCPQRVSNRRSIEGSGSQNKLHSIKFKEK